MKSFVEGAEQWLEVKINAQRVMGGTLWAGLQ